MLAIRLKGRIKVAWTKLMIIVFQKIKDKDKILEDLRKKDYPKIENLNGIEVLDYNT